MIQLSGDRVVRALKKARFRVLRQRGSHIVLRHETDFSKRLVIPVHGSKPVKPGTLRCILKGAGLSLEEFKTLMS